MKTPQLPFFTMIFCYKIWSRNESSECLSCDNGWKSNKQWQSILIISSTGQNQVTVQTQLICSAACCLWGCSSADSYLVGQNNNNTNNREAQRQLKFTSKSIPVWSKQSRREQKTRSVPECLTAHQPANEKSTKTSHRFFKGSNTEANRVSNIP